VQRADPCAPRHHERTSPNATRICCSPASVTPPLLRLLAVLLLLLLLLLLGSGYVEPPIGLKRSCWRRQTRAVGSARGQSGRR
jgi:hypothetical protein